MNELALFAGAGGGLLATQHLLGWRTVCYVEWELFPAEVLTQRIKDGYLDDAPIWDDARTFDGRTWRGCVDIITAGFPCQPFSVSGQQRGAADDRNLWPDTIRIIREVKPPYVFLENVTGLLSGHGYFGEILRELAESGYDARWRVLSSAEMGAPHKRDRIWILAYSEQARLGIGRHVPGKRQKKDGYKGKRFTSISRSSLWAGLRNRTGETIFLRKGHGVANRMDRIKALGEGQVPIVAAGAWDLLS